MKSQNLTSKELLNQLRSHKDQLFSSDTPASQWQGFDERHLKAIHMIPAKAHRRSMAVAAGLLGAILCVTAVSLYIWIVDAPQPQPVPVQAPEQMTEKTEWYTTQTDSWEELIDTSEPEPTVTSEMEGDAVLDSIPQVEQNFYIIDMQLQWLAQPQW